MSIGTRNIQNTASFALEPIQFPLGTSAISQTAKLVAGMNIPYAFQVVSVQVWALTVTATLTVDVQIGSTSVLSGAITPVAATVTAGTLSATVANTQSKTAAQLNLLYTSNGTGAATNCYATVIVRPLGAHGDAYRAAA